MRSSALCSAKSILLPVLGIALLASARLQSIAQYQQDQDSQDQYSPNQQDPPDQAGRLSAISGNVSIQTAGSDDWGQAYPNLPIGPGDRIYTDQSGQAEIQVGQSYVRIGPNTDITLVDDNANLIAFGVAQGSVHVHSFGFWQGQSLDVSSPNGDARLGQPGEIRADVWPDQGSTVFTSFGSSFVISGAGGFWQQMGNWQSLQVAGTNPVYPQWLQPNGPDNLDQWSQQRDQQIMNAASYRYVSPEVPGATELDANGDWQPDTEYGPMWFPHSVAVDWQPYHYGHWINRDPWGWVWVEDEPWGYAPFHYGRWVSYRGRWGWIPGPREQHPVWSPALVVFAGGVHFGGAGVSAWFPLGPGEPYRPWYRCSPRYIDRVNISNIRASRAVHVQNTYVNIVNVHNVTNITYVNRTSGVTAMRQADFAAGRSARQAAVQVDRRQFDRVQVVDTPAPVTRQSIVTRPVARPVPVNNVRPSFINQQGMQVTARPGAKPQAPPVRQIQQVQTAPGRTVVAPPQNARYQNAGGNGRFPNNQNPQQQGQPNGGPGGNDRGGNGRDGNDRGGRFPNQQPANTYGQQPNNGQQPNGQPQYNNQNPQQQNNQPRGPVAPNVPVNGRPVMPPQQQREGNPNPQQQDNQPRGPVAPNVPANGRPVMPPQQQQREGNPNPQQQNNQPRGPVAPNVPANGRPVMPPQQQDRNPNTPQQQPDRPNGRPDNGQPQPGQNRQDFGQAQPDRRNQRDAAPNQPDNRPGNQPQPDNRPGNQPQMRQPMPPQAQPQPQPQPQMRPTPPPPQDRNADKFQQRPQPAPQDRRQPAPPPQQNRNDNAGSRNNGNNGNHDNHDRPKDQKHDDKKDHN